MHECSVPRRRRDTPDRSVRKDEEGDLFGIRKHESRQRVVRRRKQLGARHRRCDLPLDSRVTTHTGASRLVTVLLAVCAQLRHLEHDFSRQTQPLEALAHRAPEVPPLTTSTVHTPMKADVSGTRTSCARPQPIGGLQLYSTSVLPFISPSGLRASGAQQDARGLCMNRQAKTQTGTPVH